MNSQSLLCNIKKEYEFRMFFRKNDQLHMVTLPNQNMSIKQAISYSIHRLNTQRNLDIHTNQNFYQVYGARKSGKKKDGLPAFQKTQLIGQTCLKYFCLMPHYPRVQLMSKNSSKSIETEISTESKQKNQISQNLIFGCFCLRKGSMV